MRRRQPGPPQGRTLFPYTTLFRSYFKNVMENGEPEVGTAYLAYGCALLAAQAKRMGKEADRAYYQEIAEKAKCAYRYANTENGRITSERMCRYVRPIMLDLLNEEEKRAAAYDLNCLVKRNGYRLNTGFLTSHALCRTLSDYGYTETAYRLLLGEEAPGWLYAVKQGATTILENWYGYQEDGSRKDSFNHYSYGAIVGWLMDTAAGIRLKDGQLEIAPKPCRELGYVEATYQSPFGEIKSSWAYKEDHILYNITIPANTVGQVKLVSGKAKDLPTGTYQFKENYH